MHFCYNKSKPLTQSLPVIFLLFLESHIYLRDNFSIILQQRITIQLTNFNTVCLSNISHHLTQSVCPK